jgi:hypothetical protein
MRIVQSVNTRYRLATILAAAVLVVATAESVGAQRRGWQLLGTKAIEGRVDYDEIKCHGKDTFTALQFRVTGAAVQFDRIVVEYGNHDSRPYPFRMLVRPNGASPVLDLVGGERDIATVKFWYEKASWGTKPEVRLFGRR